MDNSWPVIIFKTTYIFLVNLQEVAGGKKFLELLLEAVNFYQLPPDKESTAFGYEESTVTTSYMPRAI